MAFPNEMPEITPNTTSSISRDGRKKFTWQLSVGLFLSLTQPSDVGWRQTPRSSSARRCACLSHIVLSSGGEDHVVDVTNPRITYVQMGVSLQGKGPFPKGFYTIYSRFPLGVGPTCSGCKLYGRLFTPEDRGEGFSPVQVITAAWEIQLVAIGAPAACGLRHRVLAEDAARGTECFKLGPESLNVVFTLSK